jgi:CRP-like cAMP-binding protein
MRHRRCYAPERLDALRQLPTLESCTHEELACLDAFMTGRIIPAGRRLTVEGAVARECLLVEQGSIRITTGREELTLLAHGEWVGEQALLDGGLHTATVTTLTDTVVGALTRRELASVLAEIPSLAQQLTAPAYERYEQDARSLQGFSFLDARPSVA